tara:strand:- start:16335 stop:17141 length:807 start_codon:yes stop_codon:yes gene_type:complete
MEIFGITSIANLWETLVLILISFMVGLLGGFVGLALGTIRLPFFFLFGFPVPVSAGTNIIISTLSAATGSIRNVREGRIDWRIVIIMGIPTIIGAFAGSFFSTLIHESLLIGLAGILVFWQGIEFLFRSKMFELTNESTSRSFTFYKAATGAGIGAAIGLYGGAVGLIAGSIRLPAIIRILGLNPRIASGTNLFIGLLLGTFGFAGHGVRGEIDIPLVIFLGIAAMIGSFIGAKFTGKVKLNLLLSSIGVVFIVVGALLLVNAFYRFN